jgi:hypothetical protein
LKRASLEGQKIELNQNTLDKKHKEFLLKFYELTNESAGDLIKVRVVRVCSCAGDKDSSDH